MTRWLALSARRALPVVLVAVGGTLLACSNNNNPPPDAFAALSVGPGAGDACSFASLDATYYLVGTETSDKPVTVQDQGPSGTGTASVTCTVHPQGNGFDIALNVEVAGGNSGGSLTITSPMGAGAVSASGGSGITASFASSMGDSFQESDCKISYIYMDGAVPVSPPIAAGRIWGHLSCPHAVTTGGDTQTAPDGGQVPTSCSAEADFLFEQCSQ